MGIITITWIGILIALAIAIYTLSKKWIIIYNKFVYWITRAKRKFADIEIIMQQRVDTIHALAQIIKKYSIHEYKTLKDVIEARGGWSKDAGINEKVKAAEKTENNFLKIQAVFEKYPKLKADSLYKSMMGKGNLSRIESKLRKSRLAYNRVAQQYNERVKIFPRNIVAWFHSFRELDYLTFPDRENYKGKKIFED